MKHLLATAALTSILALASFGSWAQGEPPKPEYLVVNHSGGVEGEILRKAFFNTFEDETGIKIRDVNQEGFGKLQAMIETGNIEYDVTSFGIYDALRACELGFLEPIAPEIVDRTDFVDHAKLPCAFSYTVATTAKAYLEETFPNGGPKTWADFWDVEKFPGPRGMLNEPFDNLEFALMADGVSPDQLYPLDLDRAFRKLDEIYPNVGVWWSSGAQSAQILIDKEVAVSTGWNGRFYAAIQKGAPLKIEFTQAMINGGAWGIPKGANNAYWAQHLLAVMARPQNQAIMSEAFGYSGTNKKSIDHVRDDIKPLLPGHPNNSATLVQTNLEWWRDHSEEVVERWNAWMLSKQ